VDFTSLQDHRPLSRPCAPLVMLPQLPSRTKNKNVVSAFFVCEKSARCHLTSVQVFGTSRMRFSLTGMMAMRSRPPTTPHPTYFVSEEHQSYAALSSTSVLHRTTAQHLT
jgi:hypothetical protein